MQHSEYPSRDSGDVTRAHKRRKTALACKECRARKIKCDGKRPVCEACSKTGSGSVRCNYELNKNSEIYEIHRREIQELHDRIKSLETSRVQTDDAVEAGHNRNADNFLSPMAVFSNREEGSQSQNQRSTVPPVPTFHAHSQCSRDCSKDAGYVAGKTTGQSNESIWASNVPGHSPSVQASSISRAPQESEHHFAARSGTVESHASPTNPNARSSVNFPPVSPSNCSAGVDGMGAMEGEPEVSGCGYFGQSSAATFMRQVREMVEAKVGSPVARSKDHQFVHERFTSTGFKSPAGQNFAEDYVLPPRNTADRLLEIYWSQVHAFYPFIHKPSFLRLYEGLWSGLGATSDPRFHCILNTAFALAGQLNPAVAPETRETYSIAFFDRAKALLQFDILEVESFELVQALLMMGLYLQSTNSPSRCWIVVGLGIRIAQGLGLHQNEIIVTLPTQRDREMARRVWHGCILMDRVLALTFGRPVMISKSYTTSISLPAAIDDEYLSSEPGEENVQPYRIPSKLEFFAWTLKLYDILSEILSRLYVSGRDDPQSTPVNTQSDRVASENFSSVLELDRSLIHFSDTLPDGLKHSQASKQFDTDPIIFRQANVLKARFLHIRTLLFRPKLAQLSFAQSTLAPRDRNSAESQLKQSLLFESSLLCVRAAQKLIELLHNNLRKEPMTRPLSSPWYNVFYVYTAGTVLIAARICPRILTEITETALSQAWEHCIAVLEDYRLQSSSARRCIAALEVLNEKIALQYPATMIQASGSGPVQMQDRLMTTFQFGVSDEVQDAMTPGDIGFMNPTDMGWLNSVPFDLDIQF